MASEQDDNPFAGNSPWPRMPQAPFRVGPLPKASSGSPPGQLEPPPRAITPAFVRPLSPPASPTVRERPAIPAPPESSTPVIGSTPTVEAAPTLAPADPPAADAPPAPPQSYVEVAPVIVQPLGARVRKAGRWSPLPTLAAAGAGLAAILGIAYALSRGQEAALRGPPSQVASAPATSSSATAATPAPAMAAAAPTVAPAGIAAPSPNLPARPPVWRPKVRPHPQAKDETASPPVIALPPAPAAEPAAPPSEPLPSYTPPAAPDPNAPVTTRTPY